MMIPAMAGPTRKLLCKTMEFKVMAFIRYDAGTRRGTMAERAGQLKTSMIEETKLADDITCHNHEASPALVRKAKASVAAR